MKLLEKDNFIQFLKFAVVGVSNTLVDWLIFFLLTHLTSYFASNEVFAKVISFAVAVTNSFIWNSLWTFRKEYKAGLEAEDKRTVGAIYFGRFIAVSVVGLIFNTLVFMIIRPAAGMIFSQTALAQLSALLVATLAVLIWNFLANKFWTYKINPESLAKVRKDQNVYLVAMLMLLVMFTVSLVVSKNDSGIVDEIAHIPAGYGYLEKQDMRLNPEHPPLSKAFAALPLTFVKLNNFFDDWSWKDANQWEAGWQFLYRAGNSADFILFWSRIPMILLTLLVGWLVFIWAKKLYGTRTSLFVLFLYILSPNILAHGHWVTTDIAATLAFLAGIFFYDRYLRHATRKNLVIAGLIFGVAQLLKYSAFLLIPMMGVYLIFWVILMRKDQKFWAFFGKQMWALIQIVVIGFVLVWLVYLAFYWRTPLDVEKHLIDVSLPTVGQAPFNHFLKTLAGIPVVSAFGHYLLGFIMVFAHAEGGHTAFLLGKFSQMGFKLYFPLAFLFKESLPVLILLFASFAGIIIGLIKRKSSLISPDERREDAWNLVLFLVMPIIYFAVSINGNLNIGIRHLIPTLPFLYLLIGRFVRPVLISKISWRTFAVSGLSVWLLLETAFTYPHYMGYFNEIRLVLGLKKHQILVDSNLDWGQDLKRLAEYTKENHISEIKVDYFGGGVPTYYIPGAVEWHSKFGETKGWLAVSATFYQMSKYFGPKENQPDYSYLDNIKPTAVIGDSILVYDLK